ncbi:MAG: universal stress protein [Halobacteriales archaeon]
MKVLLGIGGSEDSLRALPRMIERAGAAGDDLTVAIVDNPESPETADEIEAAVGEELGAAGVDAAIRRVEGDPGSRLVEIAEEEGFDAIALGGGQRSPMGKIRLGPIAEFVVLNAPVSVILIR